MHRHLAFLTIMAALPGCAPTAASDRAGAKAGDCFSVSQVTGYEAVDDDTVRVEAGVGDKYDLDLGGGQCRNLDWTQKLALEGTSSSFICTGKALGQGNVIFRDPTTNRRVECYVAEVRRAVTRLEDAPHR